MDEQKHEEIEIRCMRNDDLQTILDITRTAWGKNTIHKLIEDRHGQIGVRPWWQRKTENIRDACLSRPDQVVVAETDGEIVGYAMYSIDEEDLTGEVLNNAVHPDFRNMGIGSAMHRWILDLFREKNLGVVRVSTLEHDAPARKVYEKHGFVEIARTVHYTLDLRRSGPK